MMDFPWICITNRHLCHRPFLDQIARVLARRPKAVILREKDLDADEYEALGQDVLKLCREAGIPCLFHTYYDVAERAGADGLHMPLATLRTMTAGERKEWKHLGTSCHSEEDVQEAEALGASYAVYGHVFPTDCKKGLPPRGLESLRAICQKAEFPVYAIGGVTPGRFPKLSEAGAAGACLMSWCMEM